MTAEEGRQFVAAIVADARARVGRDPLAGEILTALTFAFAFAVMDAHVDVDEALALHAQQVRGLVRRGRREIH
jgi:hypothetical protein